MKITFCLPDHNYRSPIGGYRIVYEYANMLSKQGNQVNIVYCTEESLKNLKIPVIFKKIIIKNIVRKSPKWFELDKKVKRISAPNICDEYIPDADVIFATAVTTAFKVYGLNSNKGKKCYLVQDFENWKVNDDIVFDSYKLNMHIVVISKWLLELVRPYNNNVVCIQNPVDTSFYHIKNPIENRNRYCIGMLYHRGEYKGAKYSIQVLKRIKKLYPQIQVIAFGNPDRDDDIPEWFEYIQHASKDQVVNIYNKCSIFICSSIIEGFGLTGLESMSCGCALVSSNYKGVFDYAIDEKNALLSEVKDIEAMADNIVKLIENDKYRIDLAYNGSKSAKEHSWENAMNKMNCFIKSLK